MPTAVSPRSNFAPPSRSPIHDVRLLFDDMLIIASIRLFHRLFALYSSPAFRLSKISFQLISAIFAISFAVTAAGERLVMMSIHQGLSTFGSNASLISCFSAVNSAPPIPLIPSQSAGQTSFPKAPIASLNDAIRSARSSPVKNPETSSERAPLSMPFSTCVTSPSTFLTVSWIVFPICCPSMASSPPLIKSVILSPSASKSVRLTAVSIVLTAVMIASPTRFPRPLASKSRTNPLKALVIFVSHFVILPPTFSHLIFSSAILMRLLIFAASVCPTSVHLPFSTISLIFAAKSLICGFTVAYSNMEE